MGICKDNLLTIYNSLIRSHFNYATAAWMNTTKTNQTKLQILQNKALVICTGQRRNENTRLLHTICNFNTVREEQRRLAKKYIERCYLNDNKPIIKLFDKRLDRYTDILQLKSPLMAIDTSEDEN